MSKKIDFLDYKTELFICESDSHLAGFYTFWFIYSFSRNVIIVIQIINILSKAPQPEASRVHCFGLQIALEGRHDSRSHSSRATDHQLRQASVAARHKNVWSYTNTETRVHAHAQVGRKNKRDLHTDINVIKITRK